MTAAPPARSDGPVTEPAADDAPPPPPARPSRWRLVLLAAVIAATYVVGRATGVTESLTLEGVRDAVAGAGAVGVVGFVALFAAGELVHVPGLVFVGAAVAVWGPAQGGLVAAVGALVSLVTSFVFVRGIGGKALDGVQNGLARRILGHLERRPVTTVALCRAVFVLSPPVTYALALSPVRFRDYLVGSAIGLVPPVSIAVVVFDRLLR